MKDELVMDNELMLFDRLAVIRDAVSKYGIENFYVSFSGGKDSVVMSHLIDEALPDNKIPRVYVNTGVEYFDILNYVRELRKRDDRIIIYNAGVHIPSMLKENGYPFKSKEHSHKMGTFQKSGMTKALMLYKTGKTKDGKDSRFQCPKKLLYQFEEGFDLKLSDRCCDILKKKTVHRYERESGRKIPFVGLRMAEGGMRSVRSGCAVFENGTLKRFKPLNPCTDEWCDWYIKTRNIKLCKLYYPPYNFERTGCKGCPFALDLQKQLDVMEKYLPAERKQCEYLWKPVYDEYRRLGYRLKSRQPRKLF